MTTTDQLRPQLGSAGHGEDILLAAGHAVAELLPSTQPLVPGVPQPGALATAGEWAAAVVAYLDGSSDALVGVLVGQELVDALKSSPLGQLDVADAVQPALDAAAAALGSTAGAAQGLNPATVGPTLTGKSTALPLVAGSTTGAVLFIVPAIDTTASPGTAAGSSRTAPGRPGIELLHGVAMEVTVELGRTRMSVRELLALSPGDVLELDRAAGSPADLLVNGRLIARGEVVVVDEDFALRVTEIVTNTPAS
jgi:flagellar motor switch protein FliN/FliY